LIGFSVPSTTGLGDAPITLQRPCSPTNQKQVAVLAARGIPQPIERALQARKRLELLQSKLLPAISDNS
jgi:hypothetical protein